MKQAMWHQKFQQTSEAEKGYIAGIIDGEGCIGAYEVMKESGNTYISTYISVVNTDRRLVDYLHGVIGMGSVGKHRKANGNHKASFQFRVFPGQTKQFLEVILPYLKLKCEQANLVMELNDMHRYSNGKHGRFYPERQYEILDRLRELNVKGVRHGKDKELIREMA